MATSLMQCFLERITTKQIVRISSIAIMGLVILKTIDKKISYSLRSISLKDTNQDDNPGNISLQQVSQLISNKLYSLGMKINNITYLGHGCDFDSFSFTTEHESHAYIIRIIRTKDLKNNINEINILRQKLKREMKLLHTINSQFTNHNLNINIPNYNTTKDSIVLSLQNTCDFHRSYVYASYKMINGRQLYSLGRHGIDKFFSSKSNTIQIANMLSLLHQIDTTHMNKNNIFETATDEFECLVDELEELSNKYPIEKDKEFMAFVKEVIYKCRNQLLPKWNGNKCIYGLIHGDLHSEHILLSDDNNKMVGIIDWSDVMITDVAMEFRYLWALNKGITMDIVNKYKQLRNMEKEKQMFFDFSVNIYGYVTLLMNVFWCSNRWCPWNNVEKSDQKYYMQLWKQDRKYWDSWTDSIYKLL